jgi:hypothetical protein
MTTMQTRPAAETAPATTTTNQPGRVVSIVGIVLGALAVILFPFWFGLAGLICGIVGAAKGNRLGWIAIAVSVVGAIVGIVLAHAVAGH